MTVGSLFSGIGGFDLGFERAGYDVRWQVEINPFCRAVLRRHWPDARRYADVRRVGAHNLEPVDVICGGFPCQDISPAGSRVGIDGQRSGLWKEFARIVGQLRPSYVVVENSADLLIRGMGRVVGDLASLGYDAEWEVVSACALGAPHTRERVFLVAYPAGERPRQLWRLWSEEERATERHVCWSSHEPAVSRVVDGLPHRSQRVTALGNAIVPQIAQWLAERIKEAEEMRAA